MVHCFHSSVSYFLGKKRPVKTCHNKTLWCKLKLQYAVHIVQESCPTRLFLFIVMLHVLIIANFYSCFQAAFVSIETLTLARYLLESSLLEGQFITKRASMMASSCLYLAMMMKNCGEWTATLVHYTGYSKEQLHDCVLQLNAMNSAPANKNLMTVRNKYSHQVFHEVATIPPLDPLTIQI